MKRLGRSFPSVLCNGGVHRYAQISIKSKHSGHSGHTKCGCILLLDMIWHSPYEVAVGLQILCKCASIGIQPTVDHAGDDITDLPLVSRTGAYAHDLSGEVASEHTTFGRQQVNVFVVDGVQGNIFDLYEELICCDGRDGHGRGENSCSER